ncbi:CBS domain-containing protein [Candidatus Micrarchaeota archaeon]|nr:CBS domain-containing protein [Candidatus Micrarchaeota archaeon]
MEKISKMRRQLELTQKQLASLSGVSQSLIAKIESGKIDPAYSKVMQILSALEEKQKQKKRTAGEIMSSNIVSVRSGDSLESAIKLMHKHEISQLPVFDAEKCLGSLSDSIIVELVSEKHGKLTDLKVADVMTESFPIIPYTSVTDLIADLLRHYPAVLVKKDADIIGIVTKADLLKGL